MSYYAIITKDINDTNLVNEREYNKRGQILKDQFYISRSSHILHGKQKSWFKSGKIKSEMDYDHGKIIGQLFTYWENGQLKRNDIYKNRRLKKGECLDQNGLKIDHFDYLEMPEFPGGMRYLYQYLSANLGYPLKSHDQKIEGKVIVRFIVKKDGSIADPKVYKGINDELNWEALRVIKYMPKWKPGKEDGELVNVHYSIPISFRVNH